MLADSTLFPLFRLFRHSVQSLCVYDAPLHGLHVDYMAFHAGEVRNLSMSWVIYPSAPFSLYR